MNRDSDAATLRTIKIVHTVIWAFLVACIVALPIAAWRGRFGIAVALIAIVALEAVVLVINHLRCPLTDIAARYTPDRHDNFDIYLPLWLAKYNKRIFSITFAAGLVYTGILWRGMRG